MAKVKCYSVRLEALRSISEKCCKARAFDGSEAMIPKSQIYGQDYSVSKSDAYWIAAWYMDKEDVHIQCSKKKSAFFDKDTKEQLPNQFTTK